MLRKIVVCAIAELEEKNKFFTLSPTFTFICIPGMHENCKDELGVKYDRISFIYLNDHNFIMDTGFGPLEYWCRRYRKCEPYGMGGLVVCWESLA